MRLCIDRRTGWNTVCLFHLYWNTNRVFMNPAVDRLLVLVSGTFQSVVPVLFGSVRFCSVGLFPALFCSVPFCSVLVCSGLFCSFLSVWFCSVLFHSVLFFSVLLCPVLFCFVMFCSFLSVRFGSVLVGSAWQGLAAKIMRFGIESNRSGQFELWKEPKQPWATLFWCGIRDKPHDHNGRVLGTRNMTNSCRWFLLTPLFDHHFCFPVHLTCYFALIDFLSKSWSTVAPLLPPKYMHAFSVKSQCSPFPLPVDFI